MRTFELTVVFLFTCFTLSGQNAIVRCGTTHIPVNATTVTLQNAYPRQNIEIPIVFHVLHNSDEENISEEIILSQLSAINQDYSRLDPLTSDLPKRFNNRVASPGISFCLAQTDPFGNPSDGIIRTQVFEENIANKSKTIDGERILKDSELGGQSAWDTDRYLNVWIAARDDGITGDATFPDDPSESESDGIVLDYKVVGYRLEDEGPFNLGRTLTHEIGHYLNVFHLYGSETGCFNDDDLVDDTPNQFGPYYGQCTEEVASCGDRDMDTNFMNFRDDNCIFYFTRGQVDRMIQTLFTSRYNLIGSETCSSGIPIPPDPLKLAPIISLANGIEIPLNTLSEQSYSLSLYDISGRIMWRSKSNAQHRYMIDNLGLYSNIYILVLELDSKVFARRVYINSY